MDAVSFKTEVVLESDARPDHWIVAEPLVWQDDIFGTIEVPVGLITDLASIPRFLRNIPLLDPNGKSRRPAVVHDWLYCCHEGARAQADAFLRAALMAEGLNAFGASLFYFAVHWFGQRPWDQDAVDWATTDFDTPAHFAAWQATHKKV